MIAFVALIKLHLYISVNHVHLWYCRKLSHLVRRHVDFETFCCVQHNSIFRLYSRSPLYPPPSAFKLKGTLAVFSFTDSGWITRRQIFRCAELIKVTDGFKRVKEGSWQLEITIHFLLQGEHFLLQGEHFPTLDLLESVRFNMERMSVWEPMAMQHYEKYTVQFQDVSLDHRMSLTSQSVLCELCVVECVGGSKAPWIGTGGEADCSKVWTQSASQTFTRFNDILESSTESHKLSCKLEKRQSAQWWFEWTDCIKWVNVYISGLFLL